MTTCIRNKDILIESKAINDGPVYAGPANCPSPVPLLPNFERKLPLLSNFCILLFPDPTYILSWESTLTSYRLLN